MKLSIHPRLPEVMQLLEEHFIQYDQGGLSAVYTQLLDFSGIASKEEQERLKPHLPYTHIRHLHKNYLQAVEKENTKHTALSLTTDLPIFIESSQGKDAPVVMVCAMDSLPTIPIKTGRNEYALHPHQNQTLDIKQDIGFWAPFSLIEHNQDANSLFFNQLLKSYSLYITDVYKLFFYIDKNRSDKNGRPVFSKSNSISTYRNQEIHSTLLLREIDLITPRCILTLGNNSGNALLKLYGKKLENWTAVHENGGLQIHHLSQSENAEKKIPMIAAPHISGAANGAKSLVLNHPDWRHLRGTQIEKYAQIVAHTILSNS